MNERTDTVVDQLSEAEYFEQRLDGQIEWFSKKSQFSQNAYKRLRLVEIVAGAAIPLLAGFGHGALVVSILIGLLGLLIAVIAGSMSLYRFQEKWSEYRLTAETLKQERFLYLTRAAPYTGAAAFQLLVQRVEAILRQERSGWIQAMRELRLKENADRQPAPHPENTVQ